MATFRENVSIVVAMVAHGNVPNMGVMSKPGMGTLSLIRETLDELGTPHVSIDLSSCGDRSERDRLLMDMLSEHRTKHVNDNSMLIIDTMGWLSGNKVDDSYGSTFNIIRDALETHSGIILYFPADIVLPARVLNRVYTVSM